MQFLDSDQVNNIERLAMEYGIAPLLEIEWQFLDAELYYNWYAVQPQMPYGVVTDRAEANSLLQQATTPGRVKELYAFVDWLMESPE